MGKNQKNQKKNQNGRLKKTKQIEIQSTPTIACTALVEPRV
jgi:hypothetical protein